MDYSIQDKVAAFDTLFTTNQIQKLKILMSFLDDRWQKHLAVYIKYLELQYTISYSKRYPFRLQNGQEKDDTGNFHSLVMALIPYSDESDKKRLEQFSGMIQAMEMWKQLAPMMELMNGAMPDMEGGGMFGALGNIFGGMGMSGGTDENSEKTSGADDMLMNMLMGMMTPEQKEMYENFNNLDDLEGKENE
ncbi:MAG: hypothetical protein FWC09_03610 [Lachnospiraceae bacterium]|nr:hypothetical protein [Lachnospiraceae bacterium]